MAQFPREAGQRLTRRELLRIGGLGAAGLGLAQVLRQQAAAAPNVRPRVRAVILLQHYGGPSHIDLSDPKPDAPAEIRGEFQTIATSLPGYRVSELMPHIARVCDRLTLIRSMNHPIANHNPASYLALTGHTPERDVVTAAASAGDWPAFGSVLAKYRPSTRHVPPFVQLPHIAADKDKCPGQSAGILGSRYDPLIVRGDPSDPNYRADELSLPADINAARLDDRRALLETLDPQARRQETLLQDMDAHVAQAFSILTSPRTKQAFDLGREPDKVRDRYGRNLVGQCYLLCRRLIEAGVGFVTCFNGSSPGNGWDTHRDNFQLLKTKLMPPDDQAFAALIEDLEARGLLASTLVIWAGEFGRSPYVAKAGATFVGAGGRDHWPRCYTLALAGGGMRRGFVYGSSDRHAAVPLDKPTTPADIAATLYHALGIDPRAEIRDPLGRPLPLTTGTPIDDLFA
jgi:hypothetical protein